MTHQQRPDPEIPQRKAADPTASVWVGASAGTGKTKVLTDRVLSLLLTGTLPHRLLCLTFTKAAAAEMSNRIAKRLAGWSTMADAKLSAELAKLLGRLPDDVDMTTARRLFARVLDAPGGMKIQTIHGFCQSLLRRFPLEAGLAPHFAVMDDRDAAEMMDQAKEEVLARARAGDDGKLAEALALVTSRVHETAFPDLMDELARERGRIKRMIDREGGLEPLIALAHRRLGLGPDDTPDHIIATACEDAAFDVEACRAAMRALQTGGKTDGERAALMAVWLGDPAARIQGWKDYLRAYFTTEGKVRAKLCTKKVMDGFPEAEAALLAEAERLNQVTDRWRSAMIAEATAALLRLGEALLAVYQRHKAGRSLLDYDDLILAARRLLESPGNAAWVLFKLDGGIDHVLIDEAQDTNPDQWAVVAALTLEFFAGLGARDTLRTVFAVGDVKQSIYSFQRADPRAFAQMRDLFERHVRESGATWDKVALEVSFRSTRAVLDAVDAVFTRDPGRDGVEMFGENIRHIAWRGEDAGLVEIWPPVDPREIDEPPAWKPPVERVKGDSPRARLARLIARKVQAMVGKEMLESKGRPVEAGDILVLVRRRGGFVEELVRELKILGVDVAGADRMVLIEQMAVMDLVALGNFLLLPEDDLTLASVLKGPLIGLTEEELFALAYDRGKNVHLWDVLRRRRDEAPFTEAYATLARLLSKADQMPPHELYSHILTAQGGRRKLVERLGVDAEDPIDEFMTLTLAYERAHPPSLQGFLHWLEAGEIEIKRDLEQAGRNAVRIMTVHGSKGLQAPIVFLPDTLQAPSKSPRLLWLDEMARELVVWPPSGDLHDGLCREGRDGAKLARDQEYRRLLYVAMTRAEDRLYVCGWQTRRAAPEGCWYNIIRAALAAEGFEAEDAFLAAQPEIADARVLRMTSAQTRKVEAPPARAALAATADLPPWARTQPLPEPSPPKPLAPSRIAGEEEPPVRSPLTAKDKEKPFVRGMLIHRLLQSLPEVPPSERRAACARFLDRSAWELPYRDQAEIAMEVAGILEDATFAPIFGPGSRAEVPVVGMIGERVLSGVVDRLLVTEREVLVIDFKTNRMPPRHQGDVPLVYLRQMAAYRLALACIYPGRTIRCGLLWTDGPLLMTLDPKRMDDALSGLLD